MKQSKFEITLTGKQSKEYNNVKSCLTNYLTKLKLPMSINEKHDFGFTKINYKDNQFIFKNDDKHEVEKKLHNFLLKINPKTGKICKCSDCKNCPSKRIVSEAKTNELSKN